MKPFGDTSSRLKLSHLTNSTVHRLWNIMVESTDQHTATAAAADLKTLREGNKAAKHIFDSCFYAYQQSHGDDNSAAHNNSPANTTNLVQTASSYLYPCSSRNDDHHPSPSEVEARSTRLASVVRQFASNYQIEKAKR